MTQIIAAPRSAEVAHPLDPLSAEEITTAAEVLKAHHACTDTFRFVAVSLREPGKEVFEKGIDVAREADAVLIDRGTGIAYEAVVSLKTAEVATWKPLPAGSQPPVMLDEFAEAEENCKKDPRVVEALAKRGLTDLDLVCIEPWSAGYYGETADGRRLLRCLVFVRLEPTDNPYAHPAENLVIVYDQNAGAVDRVEDHGLMPVPQEKGNYSPAYLPAPRADLKEIRIVQPDGPSYDVQGNFVTWANWSFRVGFTPREGVVLHHVRYRDGERTRSVANRMSLVEMVVPYGDPGPVQFRKNAFDAGEYNIGALANSLKLGCDCLGEIHYFDGIVCDSHGNPMTIKNAVCMHEEDDSIAWKHYDFRLDEAEVRRSRKLIVSFIATVANYEYGFYWHLYVDGTIELLVKATGILSTAAQDPTEPKTVFGQALNQDGLYGPIHQHIFSVRLDMEIDGERNSVLEVDTVVPEDNPTRSAFHTVERLLESEQQAIRKADPTSHRFWKIANREVRNSVDESVAYRLVPGADAITLAAEPDSWVSRRAGFATANLWVTPYDREQRFPAGEYPNQSTGGDGLPAFTADDRAIVDEDIVVWYTFGMHHVVRLEDWPVMPRQQVGFMLQPFGFFNQNPVLDLPVRAAPDYGVCCHDGQQ
jgi:primary-amine oxidase